MPYVNIKITQEGGPDNNGATQQQIADVIQGVTLVLQKVLNKDPSTTFVVVDEVPLNNWGIGGMPVVDYRESMT